VCGIAGFTRFHNSTGDIATLRSMGDAIAHRGPDAHGEYLDEQVGLSHRRLSIIDLSEAGTQPMSSNDSNLVLVFNGEIYNFQELRKDLEKRGYIFKTHTDTEVILALYQFEGTACVKKLNGMFAIALWDKRKQTLFLARDRVGKKPLYYFKDGKRFVFGSEIKAILEVPNIPREVRADAVSDFFTYQYIPEPKSIFKNIYKLEPGHWLMVSAKGIEKQEYWDVRFSDVSSRSENDLRDELLDIVERCTRRRMVSDVPLGAFLSGGIDSSAVVALMAKNDGKPVTTCSIGFDDEKYNEVEFARAVAEAYHTDHHEFTVHNNVEEHLEHIVSFFDEPFADQSLVPTYFVSQLARQKVTVALAGDGGDEIFAGYEKYSVDAVENRLRNFFPDGLRHTVFPTASRLLDRVNHKLFHKGASLMNSLSLDPAQGFFVSNASIKDRDWQSMISAPLRRELGEYHPSSVTTDYYQRADGEDHLSRILYTDIKTYLPGDILVKVDRMSMANSLEVRAPLLDFELLEFACKLPSALKINKGVKKYLLKKSFGTLLSDDILHRKKMGFSVPLASWLRKELKPLGERYLLNDTGNIGNYIRLDTIKIMWDEHQCGNTDYSMPLWNSLMFSMWWKKYMANYHDH